MSVLAVIRGRHGAPELRPQRHLREVHAAPQRDLYRRVRRRDARQDLRLDRQVALRAARGRGHAEPRQGRWIGDEGVGGLFGDRPC